MNFLNCLPNSESSGYFRQKSHSFWTSKVLSSKFRLTFVSERCSKNMSILFSISVFIGFVYSKHEMLGVVDENGFV